MGKKELPPEVVEYLRQQGLKGGSKGGKTAAANMTAEQRSARAKNAVDAREAKRAALAKHPSKKAKKQK